MHRIKDGEFFCVGGESYVSRTDGFAVPSRFLNGRNGGAASRLTLGDADDAHTKGFTLDPHVKDREIAALKAGNERLKAEVSKLTRLVCDSHGCDSADVAVFLATGKPPVNKPAGALLRRAFDAEDAASRSLGEEVIKLRAENEALLQGRRRAPVIEVENDD